MMTTFDQIQRSHAAGLNLIITHEPTFWSDAEKIDLSADPIYKVKNGFCLKNDIVVWRIMRLMLAEGCLLSSAGGLVGLACCRWWRDALLSLPAHLLPAGVPVPINWSVLRYCALTHIYGN
jgi:hypothetical protein